MPKYEYDCSNCGKSFFAVHGMSETLSECSLCGTEDTVLIVPSVLYAKHRTSLGKPGEIVKQYIQDTKEYIEEQKKDLVKDYER